MRSPPEVGNDHPNSSLFPKAVSIRAYETLPIVSIVVSFWGYLIGSLIYNWLNKKETTMETIDYRYNPNNLRQISQQHIESQLDRVRHERELWKEVAEYMTVRVFGGL